MLTPKLQWIRCLTPSGCFFFSICQGMRSIYYPSTETIRHRKRRVCVSVCYSSEIQNQRKISRLGKKSDSKF